MALGCRAAPFPPLRVHLKSDLGGGGKGVPHGELSHPPVGKRGYSRTSQLYFREEAFPGTFSFAEVT